LWKLKSFDAEFEDDETRYEKIKSSIQPGVYSIIWNGENDFEISVASGLYFINMRAEDYSMTGKILL